MEPLDAIDAHGSVGSHHTAPRIHGAMNPQGNIADAEYSRRTARRLLVQLAQGECIRNQSPISHSSMVPSTARTHSGVQPPARTAPEPNAASSHSGVQPPAVPIALTFADLQALPRPAKGVGGKSACQKQRELREQLMASQPRMYELDMIHGDWNWS